MIVHLADLTRSTAALMASKFASVGASVVYGRERFARSPAAQTSIVVTHDEGLGDVYDPPGTSRDSRSATWWKWTGVRAEVRGQSTHPGATEEHHRGIVEAAVDAFLVSLQMAARAPSKGCIVRGVSGRFEAPPDDQPREVGARYTLSMQIGRSVLEPQAQTGTATPIVTVTVAQGDQTQMACGPEVA